MKEARTAEWALAKWHRQLHGRGMHLVNWTARQSCARLPVLVDDPALPGAAQKLVLADYGGISVFHQGIRNSGELWYTYSPGGGNWGTDTPVSVLALSGSPSAVVF